LKDSCVRCSGLPPLYLAALILGLALLPWILRQDGVRRVWLSYTSILLGYSVLYILGNKSLFSFYIIQFTPVATATLVALTAYILKMMTGEHVIHRGIGKDELESVKKTIHYGLLTVVLPASGTPYR